ncbi:MAG: restriction endonuclease subunit S [Paludibacteraceae bacterium]|nr:restriction endonuclease subunit S [Paludibacteraceae bacterium]
MSREMKYSGIPWIGDIPCSWNIERIKTIFKERTELSKDGSEILLSVSEYYGVATRSEIVSDGEFVSRAETLVGYKKCYVGDLVSNIMLAWKGSMGITEINGIVSPAYCVYEPSQRIYPKYYHYLFRTSLYTSIFRLYSKGIIDSRLRLYSPYFFDISAIIPSLSEQQKIASFLDKKCAEIEEMITLQEKIIEELKAYKQSVITEAVTKGLNPKVPMKESGIEWVGQIPAHWEMYRIKYNTFLKGRIGWQGLNSSDFIDEGYCLITGTDFDNKGGINWDTCYRISKERFDEDELLHIKNGDLLMTKDGTVGKMAYVKNLPEEASLNSHLLIIRQTTELIDNEFLYWVMLSNVFKRFCLIHQSGSIMSSISQSTLGLFNCYFPTKSEQKDIVDYLNVKCTEIDNLISIKQQKIEHLKEYKKSIIYEYVTGKKEVED